MKFNTLLSLVFIFLISSSSVLAVHNTIKHSRTHNHKKLHNKRKYTHSSAEKLNCPSEQNFDVLNFFIGALQAINDSPVSYIVDFLRHADGKETIEEKNCKDLIKQQYVVELQNIKESVYDKVKGSLELSLSYTKEFLGLTLANKQLLEKHDKNPKALCLDNVKILKHQQEESEDWSKMSHRILEQIDKAIKMKFTLEDLKKRSSDIFKRTPKLLIYEYIRDMMPPNHDQNNIIDLLLSAKTQIGSSWQASEERKKLIKQNNSVSSCDNLPSLIKNDEICTNANYTSRAVAFWNTLNFGTVKSCLLAFGFGTIINKILTAGVNLVLKVLANLFSLFAITAAKIIYYAAKLFYNIKKAFGSQEYKEKSGYWGSAVGYGIKIVMTISGIAKKRKLK